MNMQVANICTAPKLRQNDGKIDTFKNVSN